MSLLDGVLPHALDAEGGTECFSDCPRCLANGLIAQARVDAFAEAAQHAVDCIDNGVTVLSAGEVGQAILTYGRDNPDGPHPIVKAALAPKCRHGYPAKGCCGRADECSGCGCLDAPCRAIWEEERKCCPDCSHA